MAAPKKQDDQIKDPITESTEHKSDENGNGMKRVIFRYRLPNHSKWTQISHSYGICHGYSHKNISRPIFSIYIL